MPNNPPIPLSRPGLAWPGTRGGRQHQPGRRPMTGLLGHRARIRPARFFSAPVPQRVGTPRPMEEKKKTSSDFGMLPPCV